jgi:hypothetical protein
MTQANLYGGAYQLCCMSFFRADNATFATPIPLKCFFDAVTENDCAEIINHMLGLHTVEEIVVYNGPIRPFDGLTIPLVRGTDVKSTIHHLCNGLNATNNE